MDAEQLNGLIEGKVQECLKTNNAELLWNIEGMMTKISSTTSVVHSPAVETPTFKRRSNEEQFKQNSKLLVKLEGVEANINSANLLTAKESVLEGVGLRESLKRKFDDAGTIVTDCDRVVDRMATHILASRAEGTVTKYTQQVKQFNDFCDCKGLSYNPAQSIHVAMYLSHLIDMGKSDSVITSAFYAIKWLHDINGHMDPTDSSIVKHMLECAKRCNSKPISKKYIISSEHLINLCGIYAHAVDVITLRDLCMILLCYAGFLRYNELSELKCSDIDFKSDHLVLHIRKSKTDVYRSGKYVFIANGSTCTCPISMLKRYLAASKLSKESDSFLFRPAFRSGSKCALIEKNKKLRYTRARECIVAKLRHVAPHLNLGTHSLRASGATTAANAEGVSDRCLKRHGRWKSDSAKDGYVDVL